MFKLAVCAIPIRGPVEACYAAIDEAASRGADLVLLPEEPDIVAGWPVADLPPLAEHAMFREYQVRARAGHIGVVGSLRAKVDGPDGPGTANVGFLIDRDGALVGTYRKQHPAPGEEEIVTTPEPGCERFPVFEFDDVRIGIAICMDIHFAEMFRIYMLKDADLFCVPTMYMDYTGDMLEAVEKARAADNQAYFALSRYIDEPYLAGKNMGYAKVIAPDARIIVSTGHRAGVAIAEFDPKWRMAFWEPGYNTRPGYRTLRELYRKTRNPEAYGDLVAPDDGATEAAR